MHSTAHHLLRLLLLASTVAVPVLADMSVLTTTDDTVTTSDTMLSLITYDFSHSSSEKCTKQYCLVLQASSDVCANSLPSATQEEYRKCYCPKGKAYGQLLNCVTNCYRTATRDEKNDVIEPYNWLCGDQYPGVKFPQPKDQKAVFGDSDQVTTASVDDNPNPQEDGNGSTATADPQSSDDNKGDKQGDCGSAPGRVGGYSIEMVVGGVAVLVGAMGL